MSGLTKEAFVAHWSESTLDQLRDALAEQGYVLRSKKKADAIEEGWSVYTGATQPPAPPEAPKPVGELTYEGRCAAHIVQRQRAGYSFTREWQELSPTPTADQMKALEADQFVVIRIRG